MAEILRGLTAGALGLTGLSFVAFGVGALVAVVEAVL